MLEVPLIAAPSQTLSIVLDGHACQIAVYQLGTPQRPGLPQFELTADDVYVTADSLLYGADGGAQQGYTHLYLDLLLDGEPIVTTRICSNTTRLLQDAGYLGFVGDFTFVDTQGDDDPQYSGLGARWQLIYLEASDLAS